MKVLCLFLAIFACSCANHKVKTVTKVMDEPDYKKDQRLNENSTPPRTYGDAGATIFGGDAGTSHRQTALKNLYDTAKVATPMELANTQNVISLDSAFADTTTSRTTLR